MRSFILGFLSAIVLIIAAGYGYIALGMAPVATSSGPLPFEKLITGIALDARVGREAPASSPVQASTEVFVAGAKVYQSNCAVCHGLPGEAPSPIALGEFPKPPALFKGKGVTDDPPGETYWKVSNGIRLTGMPGFNKSLTQDQLWQVSLLLANANKLPPEAQAALKGSSAP